jgi:hypothetical protein
MQSSRGTVRSFHPVLVLPIAFACGEAPLEREREPVEPVATSVESIGETACLTARRCFRACTQPERGASRV